MRQRGAGGRVQQCTSHFRAQNEVRTMRLCRHPNVVELYTSFEYKDKLWLVMELLDRGTGGDEV